jgi:hypothetical protein
MTCGIVKSFAIFWWPDAHLTSYQRRVEKLKKVDLHFADFFVLIGICEDGSYHENQGFSVSGVLVCYD